MTQEHFALLLLVVGLSLLVAEIFIPSGGILLVLAIIALAGSVWCAKVAWWDTNEKAFWWTYIFGLIVLLPVAVGVSLYAFPRTKLGRRILLEAPPLDEVTPYADEFERLSKMIGTTGQTLTLLNPGGLVLVDGERIHCESDGMLMIDPQQDVEIVAVKGNRLVVRLVRAPHDFSMSDDSQESVEGDESPLDFDVSQS